MSTRGSLLGALALLSIATCSSKPPCPEGDAEAKSIKVNRGPWTAMRMHSSALPLLEAQDAPSFMGLSGLTEGPDGELYAVTERQGVVIALQPGAFRPLALRGLAEGLDTEGIGMLPDGSIALATETSGRRDGDQVLIAVPVRDSRGQTQSYQVTDALVLSYEPWNIQAEDNKGLEALSTVGERIIVAAEAVRRDATSKTRWAPIALRDLSEDRWRYYALHLSSSTGKIAGLSCRKNKASKARLDCLAIERHYDVARILSFQIDARATSPSPIPLVPEVHIDLKPYLAPCTNPEGLVWLQDDTMYIISDNHHGKRQGPTRLMTLSPLP